MTTFDLLHPKIQKAIHDMKWENFRPIQDEAISHLIKTPSDTIICAPTASGKTEAAFLPIISQIAESGKDSIKILYISPLKALINDQFGRVMSLCQRIDFPITKWHGDANATQKAKLVKSPGGILLITPESIEALFLNKFSEMSKMFHSLEYIVIDEIHSFMGNERGTHLRSLIRRIEHNFDINPTKIGLSATISNPEDIAVWLNPQNQHSVKIIKDNDNDKDTKGLIKAFVDEDLDIELFELTKKEKNLIFANDKLTLEKYCDTMQQIAKEQKYPNNFLIHHGSLSKEIREHTEKMLKTSDNISVFCTNTLELGIDIGTIKRVIFLAPPFSVASMTQRLGRSGRKENEVKEFRFFLQEKKLDDKSDWGDKFRVQLVQSIAIVELMLEGWCEPLQSDKFDYSTFIHQIFSFLAQTGGSNPSNIYENIGKIAFGNYFTQSDFVEILKSLKEKEFIYQMPDGIITLGKKGEKLTENYEFYAAFQTPPELKVICDGKEIGKISPSNLLFLTVGSHILLAGKRWEVIEIKNNTDVILVKKAYGKKSVKFGGGTCDIHKKIHQKMLEIYETKFVPKYLSKSAIPLLEEGFDNYDTYINTINSNILVVLEGSKVQKTIAAILAYLKFDFEAVGIGFSSSEGKDKIIKTLKSFDFENINLNQFLEKAQNKYLKKFDGLLPESILNKSYLNQELDMIATKEFIASHYLF